MKALLLDVGNTRLKWGVLEDEQIHKTGHIAMHRIRDEGLGTLTSRLPRSVDTVYVCNVAGATFATRLSGVLGMHCGSEVHFAKPARQACGVRNGYRHPRRLGVDRWVAMIGAWAEVGSGCIVVDAGTAVTIDAVDDGGQHLGGQIFPGVRLMLEALAASTSDIPAVGGRLRATTGLDMFGDTTSKAVQHGAWNAVVGAVDRAITTLRSNAYDPELFLTGGDAARMLTALGTEPLHRPHLVLQGLARMLQDALDER